MFYGHGRPRLHFGLYLGRCSYWEEQRHVTDTSKCPTPAPGNIRMMIHPCGFQGVCIRLSHSFRVLCYGSEAVLLIILRHHFDHARFDPGNSRISLDVILPASFLHCPCWECETDISKEDLQKPWADFDAIVILSQSSGDVPSCTCRIRGILTAVDG